MHNHPAGRHRWTDTDTAAAHAAYRFDTDADQAIRLTQPVDWPVTPDDLPDTQPPPVSPITVALAWFIAVGIVTLLVMWSA